jgi:retron-type reverse transcriptase
VRIPKADGSKRPLGIPAIQDRVAQMAVKLVIDAGGSKYFDSILHARLMAVLEYAVESARFEIPYPHNRFARIRQNHAV